MSIRNEIGRMLRASNKPPKPYEPPPPPQHRTEGMAWYERGLDWLNRPAAASAGFAKAVLLGGNPWRAWIRNFTGDESTSFSDVLQAAGMDRGLARATLGFALDVVADPTSWLTFGTGAGAKVAVGGVTKTLTKAGGAAHAAMAAQKSARLAELIPQLASKNPKALESLLRVTGLTGIGPDLPPELLAKVAGGQIATRSLGKAIEGKAVPAGMEALLPRGAKAADIVQPTKVRFMGAPIPGSDVALRGLVAGAKGAYGLAEKVPVAGKAFTAARVLTEKAGAAAKAIFSTSTGLPEFDRLVRQYADVLDYRTMQTVALYKDKVIQPLKALRKSDPKAYEAGLKEINTFLEGVAQKSVIDAPDAAKIAEVTKRLDDLTGRLKTMDEGIQAFERGAIAELEAASKKRVADAAAMAKAENAAAREAYKQGPGEILKELKERGVRRGAALSKEEFARNIPKVLRKRAGVPVDELIQEFTRRELLPPGATENDLYKLLESLKRKPAKVTPEEILAKTEEPKLKTLPPETAARRAALEGEVAATKKALTDIPPIKQTVANVVPGPLPSHPAMAAAAQFIKQRFSDIWEAEQKGLALPPAKMEHYLPHYMKGEVRDTLIEIINSDARKIMRPEFLGSLSEAMRRTTTGKVDDIQLSHLVESGAIDPSKAREFLASRGVKLTGDDLLVFENDPVKIALNRELRSIRALNAAQMASDIMESPVFLKSKVKLGDTRAIRDTLAQHPDHAVFIPTKAFIENFKTAGEREAMRLGKDKQLAGSFLQEIERVLLDEIVENPAKAAVEAYILPREVATHLAKAYSMQVDDKAIGEFLRVWDKMSGWWKTFATAINPAFHVRNEASNLWQMMLAGVRSPASLYKGLLLLTNRPESVADIGRYTGKEVVELAERYGILRGGFVGSDIGDLVRREVAPSKNLLSVAGPLARGGTWVGTKFEDHARLALFIDQLAKGADATSAAMHVKKYLFDYRDLTKYERSIFRRLIPFYTFTRKSLPLAIETVITKPGAAAALSKAQTAGEKNVEDPIPNAYVASWIKEGLGVPVRSSGGKTEFFLLKGWIPLAELWKLDINEALGMLHPAIKEPVELALNRSAFNGQPIERFPGQKDKLLGVPMRAKAAHLLRNIVLLQLIDRHFFKQELDAARTSAGILGFRTYAQDKVVQMRSRYYELNQQIGDLKNVITLSTKRHGADSSLTRQAEERLHEVISERERVEADVLSIDPEALKTKKSDAAKPKPLPATLEGFRRRVDLDRLLRSETEGKRVAR